MSFILEALRKSERQRREIEAQPLVRLAAYSGEGKRSRWRWVLVVVIALNVAALALMGWRWFRAITPTETTTPQVGKAPVDEPTGAAMTEDRAGTSQVVAGALSADKAEPPAASLGFAEAPVPRPRLEPPAKEGPAARLKKLRGQPASSRTAPPVRSATTSRPPPEPQEPTDMADEDLGADVADPEAAAALPARRPRLGKHSSPPRSQPATSRALPEPAAVVDERFPQPKINVYAYSATKDHDRFIVIRGHKYHEGDRLEDGPQIRRIEETAVTLDYQGHSYRVPRP